MGFKTGVISGLDGDYGDYLHRGAGEASGEGISVVITHTDRFWVDWCVEHGIGGEEIEASNRPPDQHETAGDQVLSVLFFDRQLPQYDKLFYGNALPGFQSVKIDAIGNKIAMLIVSLPCDPVCSLCVGTTRNGLDRFADQIIHGYR